MQKKHVFFGIAGILLLMIFLVGNGLFTIWNGAEAAQITQAQNGTLTKLLPLPVYISGFLIDIFGLNTFILRLPNIFMLVFTGYFFYQFGKKIFGLQNCINTLLVLSSTLLLMNITKVASSDIPLFCVQLINGLLLVYYLKQPTAAQQKYYWLSCLVGGLIQPVSMAIWSISSWGFLIWKHPNGKMIKKLMPWSISLLCIFLFLIFGDLPFDYFYFGIGSASSILFLSVSLLGVLPWLGFFGGGIADMILKFRQKEELSIILLAWLIGGLLSQSLILQFVFSFMIGKQFVNYFHQNYPFQKLVKTISILHIIAIFCVAIIVIVISSLALQESGFRAASIVGATYWIPAFLCVIGLYGFKKQYVVSGAVLSGMAIVFTFWIFMYPLVERSREYPQTLVKVLSQKYPTKADTIYLDKSFESIQSSVSTYALQHYKHIKYVENIKDVPKHIPFILLHTADSTYPSLSEKLEVLTAVNVKTSYQIGLAKN